MQEKFAKGITLKTKLSLDSIFNAETGLYYEKLMMNMMIYNDFGALSNIICEHSQSFQYDHRKTNYDFFLWLFFVPCVLALFLVNVLNVTK